MSKRLLALLLAVLMAAMAMTGCAKNETPSGGGDAEGEVIELDFWIIGNYPDEKDYYLAKILEDFNETHDNIHLNITGVGSDHAEMANKWTLAGSNNKLPDLLEINTGGTLNKLIESGCMGNLYDYLMADDEFVSRFPGGTECLDQLYFGLHSVEEEKICYGFPTETEIQGWYFNTEIFEQNNLELPKTWDDYLNCVKTLKANGVLPLVHGCTDNWDTWGYHAWPIKYGLTHDVWMDIVNGKTAVKDTAFPTVCSRIVELREAGAYPDNVASMSNAQAFEIFLSGGAAMYCVGSWKMNDMDNSEIADKIAFSFGPEFPDQDVDNVATRPYSWSIAAGKKAVESEERAQACAEVMKWIVSSERATIEVEEYGHFPACIVDVEQTNLGPVGKLTADAAADSTYTSYGQGNSYMPTLAETGSDWGETWNNVVTGLIAGNTSVDDAVQQFQDLADAADTE